jgi:protein-L-isoaspartate(D-aspartate) O-methyltransferase
MADSLSRYEHTRCYRRGWIFERTGWVLMAVIIGAAAVGVFGGGALSSVDVAAGDALAVRYQRFARANAPLELAIEWAPRQLESTIWISRAYIDRFAVEQVLPAPSESTFDRERVYYTFRTNRPGERVEVVFRLRPDHGGRVTGSLGTDAAPTIELRQLIFP